MWNDLSTHEKAAIRKLALGYTREVYGAVLRRLVELGLVEHGPNTRLTEAGLALHRANPSLRKPRGAKSANTGKPSGGHAPKVERKRQPKLVANPDEVKGG